MSDAWTAAEIGAALTRQVFHRKCLLVVPTCYWTGYECDLLGVGPGMRLIDVEIKLSRSDFRADAGKDKWWRRGVSRYAGLDERGLSRYIRDPDVARQWPPRVWKHYFCLPADIWSADLLGCLPSPACGVITVSRVRQWMDSPPQVVARVARKSTPCRDARPISAADALDIARLAGLRMWDAMRALDRHSPRPTEGASG